MSTHEEVPSRHWADQTADEVIRRHPEKTELVCASGISPSGVVHIGNFREVITVEFVARSLRDRGKKVRFFHCWDDYDALRKAPANLPGQDQIKAAMRRPITAIADPYGIESSYAAHFEKLFENEIAKLGIHPEFLYQTERYESGRYAKEVAFALSHRHQIREILDRYRTTPLPADWMCVTIYCQACKRDTTEVEISDGLLLSYTCESCGDKRNVSLEKGEGVKLAWRVDWPMRWAHEGVDFEPCGKDHSTQGGSFETGVVILKEIWGKEAPYNIGYDFVIAKGLGNKLSSSSGKIITVSQALEVYQPEVVRWIFASRKPNLDFAIAFDLDVLKAYDDYDRTERIAFGKEEAEPLKKSYETRIYELSQTTSEDVDYQRAFTQFSFRHLSNILQIFEGDIDKAVAYFHDPAWAKGEEARLRARAQCAWRWVTDYAPEDFRFRLRVHGTGVDRSTLPDAMREVAALLRQAASAAMDEETLGTSIFAVMKKHSLEGKVFFAEIYRLLIGKKQGPRLASFLLAVGLGRAADLIEEGL